MEAAMRTLFIISDLHLGGRPHDVHRDGLLLPGYQFNHAYPALIEFIDWAGTQAGSGNAADIELVINGDIVDFLAEDDDEGGFQAWTADEALACAKLDCIAERTRGNDRRGVFETLGAFLHAGHRLTLLLGNHDVELSLPAVRRRLLALLGGDAAGLTFIYDGEAYRVGRVLIEHGNRYDRWNRVDYNGLREERSMRSRGLALDESLRGKRYFMPPAGSHMVVDVINRLKARYRFIDLLKPETGAVIPLLLALEPSSARYLRGAIDAYMTMPERFGDGMLSPTEPSNPDFLGKDPEPFDRVLNEALDARDARLFRACWSGPGTAPAASDHGDDLSIKSTAAAVAAQVRAGVEQVKAWQLAAADGMAALARRNIDAIADVRWRQLHAALRRVVQRDGSFDMEREDANYLDAATQIVGGGKIDVVVNGHTHLPKRLRLAPTERPCWYLNTGTWCDVLRLPDELGQEFAQAHPALDRFLAALRDNDLQHHVSRYLSYVEIRLDADLAPLGPPRLHSYCGPGHERGDPLTPYPAPRRAGLPDTERM
jgi:UDP-2,3-diacylglucosamine pyrophosphatase LpxH